MRYVYIIFKIATSSRILKLFSDDFKKKLTLKLGFRPSHSRIQRYNTNVNVRAHAIRTKTHSLRLLGLGSKYIIEKRNKMFPPKKRRKFKSFQVCSNKLDLF